MNTIDALDFVSRHHRAVLATRRQDGSPQMSPVTVGVDDDGHVVVSSSETLQKVRNIRREPAVSLCVFVDEFFGQWIQIDGTADILSLPDAMEPLVDYYRRISGEHPDWDDYRQAMIDDQRVLIRVTPERIGPR